jgi:uncharacterized membrane protein SirB2
MSPEFYKIVHMAGLLMVFLSLGGLSLHAMNGGTKSTNPERRLVAITYGIGLLLILVGGFGWLGAAGMLSSGTMPLWPWAKLALWLVIGGLLALPAIRPELGKLVWFIAPVVGVVAAWIAGTKPF